MHALEQDIAKYRGKYDAGYEPARAARFASMKKLGVINADSALSPASDSWNTVENKEWEVRCMEVYAAMIDCMDRGIGAHRRAAQERWSARQHTNSVSARQWWLCEMVGRQPNAAPPTNLKPFSRDELQPQVTPPMQTRDGRWVRTGPGVMPGPADTYVAYGRAWANVSNTPFREYKHWTHEGGISTPLIAHWPAGIPESRWNGLENQPGHLIDIMATCIDVSGAAYPRQRNDQPIKPPEGTSLRLAFRGESLDRRQPIFWEHEGNRAVRDGRWKLVAKENQPWELYDIERDRSELHNLAAEQPDRVRDLSAKWDGYAARANVLPLGGWRRDGKSNAGGAKKKQR